MPNCSRRCWSPLAVVGRLLPLLVASRRCWSPLAVVGRLSPLLVASRRCWSPLAVVGRLLPLLVASRRCWSPDQQLSPVMRDYAKLINPCFIKCCAAELVIFRQVAQSPFRLHRVIVYIVQFLSCRCWSPDQQLSPVMRDYAKLINPCFIKCCAAELVIFRQVAQSPFRLHRVIVYIVQFL
jgi:hypothetical protein